MHGYMDTWIHGFMDSWIHEYLHTEYVVRSKYSALRTYHHQRPLIAAIVYAITVPR
jgi:hypothetical protein